MGTLAVSGSFPPTPAARAVRHARAPRPSTTSICASWRKYERGRWTGSGGPTPTYPIPHTLTRATCSVLRCADTESARQIQRTRMTTQTTRTTRTSKMATSCKGLTLSRARLLVSTRRLLVPRAAPRTTIQQRLRSVRPWPTSFQGVRMRMTSSTLAAITRAVKW